MSRVKLRMNKPDNMNYSNSNIQLFILTFITAMVVAVLPVPPNVSDQQHADGIAQQQRIQLAKDVKLIRSGQEIRKSIVLVVKNCQEKWLNHFPAEASLDVVGFRWILYAAKDQTGFLHLSLDAKPPTGYTGRYDFHVYASISIWNQSLHIHKFTAGPLSSIHNDEMGQHHNENFIYQDVENINDLLDKEKGFLRQNPDDGSFEIEISAHFTIVSATLDHLVGVKMHKIPAKPLEVIWKRMRELKNAAIAKHVKSSNNKGGGHSSKHTFKRSIELVAVRSRKLLNPTNTVSSDPPIEFLGFQWFLQVSVKEKKFVSLYLYAKPLDDFRSHWIKADINFAIMNFAINSDESIGKTAHGIYKDNDGHEYARVGIDEMAKYEPNNLLNDCFYRIVDGAIKVKVDLSIIDSSYTKEELNRFEQQEEKEKAKQVKVGQMKKALELTTEVMMPISDDDVLVSPIKNEKSAIEKSIELDDKSGQKLTAKDKHSSSRLIIQNCTELFKKKEKFQIHSTPTKLAGFKWYYLRAENIKPGFLSLAVIAKPAWQKYIDYGFEVEYHIELMNEKFPDKNLLKKGVGYIYRRNGRTHTGILQHIANEFLLDSENGFLRADNSVEFMVDLTVKSRKFKRPKMKEMVPTNSIMALAHDVGLIKNRRPIRKEFQFVIEKCPELFKGEKQFRVRSAPIDVLGFEWYLLAENFRKDFLTLALIVKPADQFKGHYRIELEYQITVLSKYHGRNLVKEGFGVIYRRNDGMLQHTDITDHVEIKYLFDTVSGFGPAGFIQDDKEHSHGFMKIHVEFSIKSSTWDHLNLMHGSTRASHRKHAIIQNPVVPTKEMMMLTHEVGLVKNGLWFRAQFPSFAIKTEAFEKGKVEVASSAPINVLDFAWKLHAKTDDTGLLSFVLVATSPNGYKGKYAINIFPHISVWNESSDEALIFVAKSEEIYRKNSANHNNELICANDRAKLSHLLNPANGFLHPADNAIRVEAEFTIISSTLGHLDLMELDRLNEVTLLDDQNTQTEPTIREEIRGSEENSSKQIEQLAAQSAINIHHSNLSSEGGHSKHIHGVNEEKQEDVEESHSESYDKTIEPSQEAPVPIAAHRANEEEPNEQILEMAPMENAVGTSDDSSNKGGHPVHIHDHEMKEEKQKTAVETVEEMIKTETKYPMSAEDGQWIRRAKAMMWQDEERRISMSKLVNRPLMQNAIIKTQESSHNAKQSEKAIKEIIDLDIPNCSQLKDPKLNAHSDPPTEFHGFSWILEAKSMEEGFLGLYLYAKPLNGNKGHRIEADISFFLNNSSGNMELAKKRIKGIVFKDNLAEPTNYSGNGVQRMATFDYLLSSDGDSIPRADANGAIKAKAEIVIRNTSSLGSSAPSPNESLNVLDTNPLLPSTLGQHSTHIHPQQAKEEKQEIVEKKSIVPSKEVPVQIERHSKGEVPVSKSSSQKKSVSKMQFGKIKLPAVNDDWSTYPHTIALTINQVQTKLKQDKFKDDSADNPSVVDGFNWYLKVEKTDEAEANQLNVFLSASPPEHFKTDNYRMEVHYRFTIVNRFAQHWVKTGSGQLPCKDDQKKFVLAQQFEIDVLLDSEKGFSDDLSNDSITILAEFGIKSFTPPAEQLSEMMAVHHHQENPTVPTMATKQEAIKNDDGTAL